MRSIIMAYMEKLTANRARNRRLAVVLCLLSVIVAGSVFWQLRVTGITKTAEPGAADISADVETAADWEATLPGDICGIWADDLVATAKSQIGYTESEQNYTLAEDGVTKLGYSRYGAWYGNAYGNWDAMFVSFCLSYSGISQEELPYASSCVVFENMLQERDLFVYDGPQTGDIIFLDMIGDGSANHVGIISEISDGTIYTVEGDVEDTVVQSSYGINDDRIIGFGRCAQDGEQNVEDIDMAESVESSEPKREMTSTGDDYTVTVSFSDEAGIPESAELAVSEIEAGSSEYEDYYQQALGAMRLDDDPVFCRFFDVSFIDDGEEIEPLAPVDVAIIYHDSLPTVEDEKCSAVHFASDGIEIIDTQIKATDEGDAVVFTQDSFSIVGTVIEGTVTLTPGSEYIFYTGDGYAMGVVGTSAYGFNVAPIPVTVGNNGYITPTDSGVEIERICWTYQNGGLLNAKSQSYLKIVASSPTQITGGRYTSTVGLTSTVTALSSKVINNDVKLTEKPYSSMSEFTLAYENGAFKSGTEFDNAEMYFLTANVVNVEDILVDPGDLEVEDDILNSGCIKPKWNIALPGTELTYVWEKSTDNGATWSEVERRKVTGSSYNVAEDGSWLNVSLDDGSEMQYRVSLVAADGATLTSPYQSKVYYVTYFDELKNGDFEKPWIYDGTTTGYYQPFIPNGTYDMVWRTTAADGQIEYVSVASTDFQYLSERWHLCEAASRGSQYVELNATQDGALYQDVLTVPGSTMYWNLDHRGRGTVYQSGQQDTMYVVVMSTKLAEQYNITTQSAVQDVIDNPTLYPGAAVRSITSDNVSWHTYTGDYEVPENQYLSRYFFVSGRTASNDNTVGNHLDNVSFSTTLPPPDPDKANIEIEKTIVGVSYEDASELLSKLEFSIYDAGNGYYLNDISGGQFGLLTDNGDGTFTASYTVRNVGISTYRAMEDTSGSKAEITNYNRTTTATSANGIGASYYNGNYYCLDFNVSAGGTSTVTFSNEYVKKTINITLQKENNAGNPLVAEFELSSYTDGAWSAPSTITTNDGQAVLTSLNYDTRYRLTETKAPDGYVMRTDSIYFTISENDGIKFCTASGEVIAAVADVSAETSTITVINHAGFVLPKTGGTGNGFYAAAGILLMTGAIILCCKFRNRPERRLMI